MGNIYLISDLHFGHHNMALHRGFNDIYEHDNHIIEHYNSVVKKGDTCWILGDITMEKSMYYYRLDLLNGYKKVVLGNHDQPQHVQELLKYVNSVCGIYKLKDFWLTHIPMHESELRGHKNIHGHNHGAENISENYFNVSCESLNYKPININNIL